MYNVSRIGTLIVCCVYLVIANYIPVNAEEKVLLESVQVTASVTELVTEKIITEETTQENNATTTETTTAEAKETTTKANKKSSNTNCKFTDDDIYLMALVTIAEAEGESEYGQRLVIDTILNRVSHSHFPDNVHDVVYQKNQFSSMTNGRANRCKVTDYLLELVKSEIQNQTNTKVMFFRGQHYSECGSPMFKVGNHYFSSM